MLISKGTRFGIAMPQMFHAGTTVDVAMVGEHLRLVESLGYESAWVQDQSTGTMQVLDPLTLLAHAASCTKVVKLGVSVLVMPFRNPINLAKSMATLDHLSGGRMILGVGIGGNQAQYPAFGITSHRRVTRFEESIELLKRLWTESSLSLDGEFWRGEDITVEPKPVQKPRIPIWFGGQAEPALERSARMGDAWMGAGSSSIAQYKWAIAKMREYLAALDRDPAQYTLGKRVYVAIDKDKETAAGKLRHWFAGYYGDAELATKVSIYGNEGAVVDGLGELMEEAPDMLMLNPVYDLLEHPQRLASDIIPKLG